MNLKHIFILLILIILLAPTFLFSQNGADSSSDSSSVPYPEYMTIRGIERDETHSGDKFRSFLNVLFFVPRKMLDGILFSAIYGARLLIGSKEIERADAYFLKIPKTVVWTPILFVDSDLRPLVGLTVLYRKSRYGSLVGGSYTAEHKWGLRADITYTILRKLGIWKVKLRGLIDEDDDRRYYGIGAEPKTDERSHFLPGTTSEYGIYSQRREKVDVVLGIRPTKYWEFFLSSLLQKRRLENAGYTEPLIGDVADLSEIQGGNRVNQWYNEIAVRYDTRAYRGRFSKGVKIDSYFGISNGVDEDKSRFLRAGIDLAGFFRVIKNNRFIVPRILFDMVGNLEDNVDIPFTEYPHIREYRGTAKSNVIRTDNYTLLPSLEYQWPISTRINAHLFYDYFMVAKELDKFSLGNGLWAVGLGFDFHTFQEEVLRFEFVAGSDGFRMRLNFGLSNFSRRDIN